MIKTAVMIFVYGLVMMAKIAGVILLAMSPFVLVASIGYLIGGKDGAWSALGIVGVLFLIMLTGILAGANWYGNNFDGWKWEKDV